MTEQPAARRAFPFVLLASFVMCLLGASLGGQQRELPGFKSGVDLVTIDLTVLTRGGEPIVDLGPSDVTVLVDGRPRPVVSLRLIRFESGQSVLRPEPPPEVKAILPVVPAEESRVIVLVVDREQIPQGEGGQMLAAAAKFIDGLAPSDRAAVWDIPATSTRLQFTADRGALERRIRTMPGTETPPYYGPWMIANEEAIQIQERVPNAFKDVVERECYKQPPTCPQEVQSQANQRALDIRRRTRATMIDIESLVDAVAPLEGPKHLVWITAGPPIIREYQADLRRIIDKAAAARVIVHALQVWVAPYQARTDSMRATPVQTDHTLSLSYSIAAATGGLSITALSGEVAFEQFAKNVSATYLLAIETAPADRDGKMHAIDVKVANRGFGVTVRARKSFKIDLRPRD